MTTGIIKDVTPDIIKGWEKAKIEVEELTIFDEHEEIVNEKGETDSVGIGKGISVYVKKPSRAQMKYMHLLSTSKDGRSDMISPGESLLNSCWIGGDVALKTDDARYFKLCIEATLYLMKLMGFIPA